MPFQRNGAHRPVIESVSPVAALPGGDLQIRGRDLTRADRPGVTIGNSPAALIVASDSYVVARVPDVAHAESLTVHNGERESEPYPIAVAEQLMDSLHPVANPAVTPEGAVYTTFSGSRGQKTPVAVYRIEPDGSATPFLTDLMNATGLALDRDGVLYVSSRFDGTVYQVTGSGEMSVFVEGMGVATGLAFDRDGNLFVGDRSGTIFKISPNRQIYVFATVEPSISAYHLAFSQNGDLYLTGPTTSSFDSVFRINPAGDVQVFYRGLGRPQGMAFDIEGNLYVAASLAGRKGIVRITPDGQPSLFLAGPNIVGLAFAPRGHMVITTTGALYRVQTGITGLPIS
jgi:sugar lactone lactonase YvrE